MAFELFDRVRIDAKNVIGNIVDIHTRRNGEVIYIVESAKRGHVDDPDAYPGEFPLYDCTADQITKIT